MEDTNLNEQRLRAWLASHLGRPDVEDWLWNYLVDERYVADSEDVEGREILLKTARGLRKIARDANRERVVNASLPKRTKHTTLTNYELMRVELLADQFAWSAAALPQVAHFRTRALDDALLSSDEASALLQSPAARVFSIEQFIRRDIALSNHLVSHVTESEGTSEGVHWRSFAARFAPAEPVRVLERRYDVSSDLAKRPHGELLFPSANGGEQRVAVWPDSALHVLHRIGTDIAHAIPWSVRDAIWFILTGERARVTALHHEVVPVGDGALDYKTIVLTVAPWVSADSVQRAYRAAQEGVLGSDNRPVGERSMTLYRFVRDQRARARARVRWRTLLQDWTTYIPTGNLLMCAASIATTCALHDSLE